MTEGRGVFPLAATSPDAPLDDLKPLRAIVGDAAVVGIARGAHGTDELTRLSHRLVSYLVDELGFRVLAIEASPEIAWRVDGWLRRGRGDLAELLREAHPWWRAEPFVDVLRWVRRFNRRHGHDPVGLVGVESTQPSMDALERAMAAQVLDVHSVSGRRIVYWSGSHSAVGDRRSVRWRDADPDDPGGRNAGSHLRAQLGGRYRSLALSFHHGAARLGDDEVDIPAAPRDYLGTLLDAHGPALHALHAGHEVAERPLRYRLVGPHYDPDRPSEMSGGPVAAFFDAVLHVDEVSPIGPPEGGGP